MEHSETSRKEAARRVKQACIDWRVSVATAESVTAGRLQALIASVTGSSAYFRGGITAYDIERKVRLLQVDRSHAEQIDCVSDKVAAEMAQAATRLFDADCALSTTGYAEPPDPTRSLLPYAHYAIWDARVSAELNPVRYGQVTSEGRERQETQQYFAECVLAELADYLFSR